MSGVGELDGVRAPVAPESARGEGRARGMPADGTDAGRGPVRTGTRGLGGPALYALLGIYFGVLIIKAEVASWFRIQEMFRFQSFHMYGILASAVLVAGLSVAVLKQTRVRSLSGDPISMSPKTLGRGIRYLAGGTLFGLGWALSGACPGAQLALTGSGVTVMVVTFMSAVLGTWVYGYLRPRLPH